MLCVSGAARSRAGIDAAQKFKVRSRSENGDFMYFVPWGNLGFYYNAEVIEFNDSVVLIGTYEATPE